MGCEATPPSAPSVNSGAVAKRQRQRIANPSSLVQIQAAPLENVVQWTCATMTLALRRDTQPRVVLLTSPGLFGAEIINRLATAERINLVGVGLTDRLYKGKGLAASVRTFLKRTGWRYVAYNALQANVAWTWL